MITPMITFNNIIMPWQRWWRHYAFRLSTYHIRLSVHPDSSCYNNISWTAWAVSMKLIKHIH